MQKIHVWLDCMHGRVRAVHQWCLVCVAVYYKQTADKTKVDLDEHRAKDVSTNCCLLVCNVISLSACTPIVRGTNGVTGAVRGGNFYHIILESSADILGFMKNPDGPVKAMINRGNALPWQPSVKFSQMHLMTQNVISQQPATCIFHELQDVRFQKNVR